jgi:hypothetical protein
MIMKDPGKKNVMFPINKKIDPLMVKRNTVSADPDSYLGTLATKGSYSGCAPKTLTDPDTYTEEVCDQFLKREDKTCYETLTVSVTSVTKGTSCISGTWFTIKDQVLAGFYHVLVQGLCNSVGTDGKMTFRIGTAGMGLSCGYNAPFNVNIMTANSGNGSAMNVILDTPNGKPQCKPISINTSFTSNGCDASGNCSVLFNIHTPNTLSALGYFTIPESKTTTITDTWDDKCAALKARLP